MTKRIAFVAGERYRHYLDGVESRLVHEGAQVDYYDPDAFCGIRDFSEIACVVTIHSIDEKLMDALRGLKGRVPTVTLQDGLIEYAHCCLKEKSRHRYRPIATDYLLTFGERPKKIALSRCGSASVLATGSPRFDAYHQYKTRPVDASEPFLVTTANTPWHDRRSRKDFSRIFIQLLGALHEMRIDFKLRLPDKVHKELSLSSPFAFRKALKSRYLKGLGGKDESLVEAVLTSSAVVTTPSTVALEAMILERPTSIIQPGFYPMYLESAFQLTSRESFGPVLGSLASRGGDFDDRMAFQSVIKGENVIDDGQATERVVALIQDILA